MRFIDRGKVQTVVFWFYRLARKFSSLPLIDKFIPFRLKTFIRIQIVNILNRTILNVEYSHVYNPTPVVANPLVSVLLPTYNQADYLEASIDSILTQTYTNLELIIINDGSTDNTRNILELYKLNQRVKVYEQSNEGLPNALNMGLEKSSGELITWTSSDNLMLPGAVMLLVKAIYKNPSASLVYGDYEVIDENNNALDADNFWRYHNRHADNPSFVKLPRDGKLRNRMPDNFIGPYFMFRKSIVAEIGPFARVQGVEDYDFWLRCERLGPLVHIQNESMQYRYRVHKNSLSANYQELKIVENVRKLVDVQQLRDRCDGSNKFTPDLTEENCDGFREASTWATRIWNPFRVLFLLDSWGIGGLENVVIDQVRYFKKQNCNVKLVVSSEILENEEVRINLDMTYVKTNSEFRKFIEDWKPDVVICHYSYRYISILDDQNIPYVQVYHNTYVWLNNQEISWRMNASVNASRNICVSKSVAWYSISKFQLDPKKTLIIPNGIDANQLRSLNPKDKSPVEASLLVAASYTPHKRQWLVLAAFKNVLSEFPKSKLTFVGHIPNKPYFESLIKKADEIGINESVNFRGYTENMKEIYRECNIAVSASLFEGWSLSLSEAAYLGMPIVATRVGGAAELASYTKVFLVENYLESLLDIDATNLYEYSLKSNPEQVRELTKQILNAIRFLHEKTGETIKVKNTLPKWGLDSDYASSQYYDCCVEVICERTQQNKEINQTAK